MSVKLLLDTDIGTDIDDAVCLAYLLANKECDLLGITTVTGEAKKRAMLASAICKVAGKSIPIYPGCENPLLIEQRQKIAIQAEALNRWDHDKDFPEGQAIEFLRKTIRENPGEVTLLTIGPLTNIGLLFSIDPEIPSLLKGLIMMCGYFFRTLPDVNLLEWNAIGDYHASEIVYRANAAVHRSIGLDVTCRVQMSSEEFKKTYTFDIFRPVLDFSKVWFEKYYDYVTFHDPLAAATIFNNQICQFKSGNVSIEMNRTKLRGLTRWKNNPSGRHEAAYDVDKSIFFEHYLSVFK